MHIKIARVLAVLLCVLTVLSAVPAYAVGMPAMIREETEPVEILPYHGIEGQIIIPEKMHSPAPFSSDGSLPENMSGFGYIGEPFEAGALNKDWESPELLSGLPAKLDPREHDLISSVKNQGNDGTCWAFAAIGAVESNLIRKGLASKSLDLSELQLINYTYNRNAACAAAGGGTKGDIVKHIAAGSNDNIMKYGGNTANALNAMSCWLGLIPESELAYENAANVNKVLNDSLETVCAYSKDAYHLDHAYYINSDSDPDAVKSLLMSHGAATLSFAAIEGGYNSENFSYYQNDYSGANHAVTLCGWDDAFPRTKFNKNPGRDGAWLIKNSWGTDWGDEGYFWLSYADPSIEGVYFIDVKSADDYDHLYQYDGGLYDAFFFYNNKSTAWVASIFEINGDEMLSAVRIRTLASNAAVTVKIYSGVSNDPTRGTLLASVTQSCPYSGYYTVQLPNGGVSVASGTKVSAVVATSIPSGQLYIPLDYPQTEGTKQSSVVCLPGQSYISANGAEWEDIYSTPFQSNVRVKLLTKDAGSVRGVSGDVDFDGHVSLSDAILIVRYILGYASFSTVKQAQADVNGDGKIDVLDTVTICKMIAGLLR